MSLSSPPPGPHIRQTHPPRRRAASREHHPQDLELELLSEYTGQSTATPSLFPTSTALPVLHAHTRDSTVPSPGRTLAKVPASQVEPPDILFTAPASTHIENIPHFPTLSSGLLNTSRSPITATLGQAPSSSHLPAYPASSTHSPPPSSPTSLGISQDPIPDAAGTLSGLMESANFPLLQTSPAIGTGSYGALPTMGNGLGGSSYTGSALSSTSEEGGSIHEVEDDDVVGEVVAAEGMEENGFLSLDGRGGGPERARNKWRKRTDTVGLGIQERESKNKDKWMMNGSTDTNGEHSYDVLSGSDEEEIRDDDPINNSP